MYTNLFLVSVGVRLIMPKWILSRYIISCIYMQNLSKWMFIVHKFINMHIMRAQLFVLSLKYRNQLCYLMFARILLGRWRLLIMF